MIAKIGISNNVQSSRDIINEELSNKKFRIEEEILEDIYFFHIAAESKFLSKKDYYSIITNIIMDIIFDAYSTDILNKKIYKERKDIKNNEKDEIIRLAREKLLDKNNFKLEKNQIHNQIKEYMIENHSIYIDGFIQFRIKEFELFIDMVIDRGIDEFTLEKEYKEFIKILQYFVDVQESKYNLINIIFENNDYLLLDEGDNILDKDFFSEIVEEIEPGGISKDDLLISTLIVLAPKKIFIHMDKVNENEDLIKIISSVFQDKVYFCFGCPKCSGETKIKRGK
ncbi:MAG: hypothetical protein GX968_05800 [Tissierellia bacterium]|nr:hypothetical protein [Tissierellia bacterium]